MAPNRNVPNPVRTLGVLFALMALFTGLMFLQKDTTPKLGLDLAGGTTVTMTAQTEGGKKVPQDVLDRAVQIIRDRVNGSGLTDAEVAKQGDDVIVVSIPGDENDQKKIIDLVGTTAQMQFRQALAVEAGAPQAPIPTTSPTGTGSPSAKPSSKSSAKPSESPSSKNRAMSQAFAAPTPNPTTSPSSSPSASPSAQQSLPPELTGTDFSKVKDPAVIKQFQETVCTRDGTKVPGGDDPKKEYVVACDQDGQAKYILGPVKVEGTEIKDANAVPPNPSEGQNTWSVGMDFKTKGGQQFGDLTKVADAAYRTNPGSPEAQIAIVLDGLVISAPQISRGPILQGRASIDGGADFTEAYARNLSEALKYGGLPVKFPEDKRTIESVSSTLGADQLRGGLVAGAIGLGLVVLYCLFYYRALGLVAVTSLIVAAAITWISVVILGHNAGFRLSLPHIIGLIVSIGITADSFIVYFERLRDELRAGRPLRPSVEVAWVRARRTILVADAVTFIAALVLYFLAVGGVRGFAFAMGLTTLIDVVVVFFFTKPLLAWLARFKFFSQGHKLSGLDSARVGKKTPITRLKRQEA